MPVPCTGRSAEVVSLFVIVLNVDWWSLPRPRQAINCRVNCNENRGFSVTSRQSGNRLKVTQLHSDVLR